MHQRIDADKLDEFSKNFSSLLERVLILLLCDSCVGITDDGDQHIEDVDLCNDGGEYKKEPDQVGVSVFGIVIKTKFAKTQQVLVQKTVHDIVSFRAQFIAKVVINNLWVLLILALGCSFACQVQN